jgi:phosphonate transport system ATP-binding protein
VVDERGLAFQLQGVGLCYGAQVALEDVTLDIAAGEAVGLVGPSGAGKTSLLRLLGAALPPGEGRLTIAGQDLATASPRALRQLRASLGFIHQDLRLVPNLRVSQNVLAGRLGRLGFLGSLRHLLLPRRSEVAAVHALLERVGIEDKLFARSDRLSGGQLQRVAIARALHQQPRAMLADEPVASVDPARARDTVVLLTRICAEEGLTLVMSLHNLALAREHFPRLVGLRAGRVAFDAPVDQVDEAQFAALYDLDESLHRAGEHGG